MLHDLYSNHQENRSGVDRVIAMNKLIKSKSLSEQAYDSLCDMIAKMEPGQNRLPSEDELARTLGVSRATIREALKYLLMDGVITTIHGKGTFAHPSVFSIKSRMDLSSDFYLVLSKQYEDVDVEIDWIGFVPPSEVFINYFGAEYDNVLSSDWVFYANGVPMLYAKFEICPKYITQNFDLKTNVKSLSQFSAKYMRSRVDYCIKTAKIRSSQIAEEKLGLHDNPYFFSWDERIIDIDDHLVAIGSVYPHPANMEFSTVTRFEI